MGSLQKYKEPADMITDFSTDKPIHVQILDYCMDCVGDGQWIAGERIPSVKELSVAMVVNPRTVMRAYEALEERGIVFQRRGLGFYVADGAVDKVVSERRDEFETVVLPDFMARLHKAGISIDELIDRLTAMKAGS